MTNTNKRYIDIDTDTRVGFNYIKQQFYVTNKEYTTYRNTVADIQEVLAALEITTITDEELQELKDYTEDLYKVYFTIQDTGAYIHTLQFNDFDEYPLTIDCEKKKLYIMNSTIIYDLTLNESPRNVRIPRILSFYKNTLGLLISTMDMRYFYSLLLSYYYPTCYNQVILNADTEEYFYNNKFILSNYSNTSNATYICTYDPKNTANLAQIGYVTSTSTTDNTITLSENITPDDLQGYNKVILSGANTYMEDTDTEYSADGEYTVTAIGDNILKVNETMPYAYSFPYKECYVLAAQYSISKMERDTRQITLTSSPTDILVGDLILVSGATVTDTYETISCNGTYTVEAISGSVITVEEEIPTNFTGTATLIKEVFLGNIEDIASNVITLTEDTDLTLTGATITIHTIENGETIITNFPVAAQSTNTITVTGEISDYNYTNTCPKLYLPIPDSSANAEVLIDVTTVSDNAKDIFPMGEFMVDNFNQCKDYIGILAGLVKPTETTKENLYKKLPKYMYFDRIPDLTTANTSDYITCNIGKEEGDPSGKMQFISVYSQKYSEE